MTVRMEFDGRDMSDLFLVNHVHRDIFPDRTQTKRILPVDITIVDEMLLKKEILSGIFAEDEYKSMIFSDEPHKEWFGKVVGNTSLSPVYPFYQTTLEFELKQKTARSTEPIEYLATGDTLEVINEGTAEAPLRFEVDFPSDNGFFTVVAPGGIIQVGEPAQVDKVPVERSSVNIHDSMVNLSNWRVNDGVAKPYHSGLYSKVDGSMRADVEGGFLLPQSFGTGTSWHGPMLSRNLDAMGSWDRMNWEMELFLRFEDRYAEKTGILEIAVVDEIGDNMFRVVFLNTQTKSSQNWIQCWARGDVMWEDKTSWDWQHFLGTVKVRKMGPDYNVTIKNRNNGKEVSFHYFDSTGEVHLAPAERLQIWHAQWGTEPAMYDMGVSEVKFTQHKTKYIEDVPNVFTAGDRLVIDTETGEVSKGLTKSQNAVRFGNALDVGSKFFKVKPGTTDLKFLWSGFAATPTIKAIMRERWW